MFNRDRKFWGWGTTTHQTPSQVVDVARYFLASKLGVEPGEPRKVPALEDLHMPEPRCAIPSEFASIMTQDRYDRAAHTYGKAFRDVVRALDGDFSPAPDLVAYPQNEEDIVEILVWAAQENVAVIPYGGGSSVCGGIEYRSAPNTHHAVLSLDLCHLRRVLEIDKDSRTARIQAGVYGPDLESQLKPHALTLRHFPQSFEFSTLGGWIATRAGGHFATNYTHIDDFVQSVRMVTPQGVLQTRRLPGNGAGPQEEGLILGSEGIFGIITEAWMRLQDRPTYRAGCTVHFRTFKDGVQACKALSQSGLFPANARLIEADEAFFMGAGDGQHHLLLLAFESATHSQKQALQHAMKLCEHAGGTCLTPRIREETQTNTHDPSDADDWKHAFTQAPYLRDEIARAGYIIETFETCTTWQNFPALDAAIRAAAKQSAEARCGNHMITCRFTHLYPDGPAPYYTVIAKGQAEQQLQDWDAIKTAVSNAIIEHGATITHHHAVGKDHAPWYAQQNDPLSLAMLRAAKSTVDPQGILNPNTLLKI